MITKKRKKLKHSLKTAIDRADMFIRLSTIGIQLDATNEPSTDETRKTLVYELKKVRQEIHDKCIDFLAEIDNTIDKIS